MHNNFIYCPVRFFNVHQIIICAFPVFKVYMALYTKHISQSKLENFIGIIIATDIFGIRCYLVTLMDLGGFRLSGSRSFKGKSRFSYFSLLFGHDFIFVVQRWQHLGACDGVTDDFIYN
jgi:hypothetical protein